MTIRLLMKRRGKAHHDGQTDETNVGATISVLILVHWTGYFCSARRVSAQRPKRTSGHQAVWNLMEPDHTSPLAGEVVFNLETCTDASAIADDYKYTYSSEDIFACFFMY